MISLHGDVEIVRLESGEWRLTYLRHVRMANPDTGDVIAQTVVERTVQAATLDEAFRQLADFVASNRDKP